MNKKQKHAIKVSVFFIVVPILIFVLAILALRIGSVNYSTAEIFNGLFDANSSVHTIIIDLRLPRVILAIIIGMCLAAAGALLQAVMQNPLARPRYYRCFIRRQYGGNYHLFGISHSYRFCADFFLRWCGRCLCTDLFIVLEKGC